VVKIDDIKLHQSLMELNDPCYAIC
jgi:hypothetical protein